MEVFSHPLIPDVKTIIPQVFGDSRGWFVEQYNAERYKAAGITADFVQDNESFSSKGVVRGLHWQAAPYTQAKLVRVIRGAVWDVAVDIRKGSPTFGKYACQYLYSPDSSFAKSSLHLSSSPCKIAPFAQFYIPRGFAHGFIVLEDNTLFSYKCDNLYHPEADRGMLFSDSELGIEWPKLDIPVLLSEKDRKHPKLSEIDPYCE